MDELIDRAKKGDRDALNRLVSENYDSVYRFAARRLGPEAAKDAAQETFLTMQKTIKGFRGSSPFGSWLLGITHNHVRNMSRKRKHEPLPLENWLETTGDQPEDSLIARDTLTRALKTLTEEHRQVILMHEIEGLRYSEIADILIIPEGTVKSRLHNAFKAMRASLAEVTP